MNPKNLEPGSNCWQLHGAKEGMQKPLQRSSLTPDTSVVEVRLKVVKFEKAQEAFEGTDGVEVDAIKKALVKAKAAANEEVCHRADRKMQEFHRSGRKTVGEVGCRARVGESSVGGGAHGLRVWKPMPPFRCFYLPQSLLQTWKQGCCAFEQSWPTHAPRQHQEVSCSRIVSRRVSSPTQWKGPLSG